MIQFNGLIKNDAIDLIKECNGFRLQGIVLQRGIIKSTNAFSLSAFDRFAMSFIIEKKVRHIIFSNQTYKPHPLIWEHNVVNIQVIDEQHKPLREKMIRPSHGLDSTFDVSISCFEKEATLKKIVAYGNQVEGTFSFCYPEITTEEFQESNLTGTEFVKVDSIELLEIYLNNNSKIFIVVREHGFDFEINSEKNVDAIIKEYFDDRFNLKIQHVISK